MQNTGVKTIADFGRRDCFARYCCFGVLVIVICSAVALRLSRAVDVAMTSDEGFTWRLIQYSWTELVERTANDVHPPLYYWVVKLWGTAFGTSLLSLRSLSVVVAAAAVVLMYWVARRSLAALSVGRLGAQAGGLLAAAAFAVHPLQIEIGSTARMYPLGVLLALLSTAFLQQIQLQPERRRLFAVLYGLAGAGLCYTHNFGLLVVAAQAVYAAAFFWIPPQTADDRAMGRTLAVAFLLVAAIYMPWVAATVRQLATVARGYWIMDLTVAHGTDLLAAWLLGSASGIWLPPLSTEERTFAILLLGGIIAAALFRGSRVHVQLVTESFGPWVAVILVYIGLGQSFALLRCFSFALASLILLGTLVIPLIPSIFGRAVFTSACYLPMLWYGAESAWRHGPEWDAKAGAIEIAARHWQGGDALVVRRINDMNVLRYHAVAAGIKNFDAHCLVGPFKDRQDHWVHAASLEEETELITSLSALTPPKCGRIWVLARHALPRERDIAPWRQRSAWQLADGSHLVLYHAVAAEPE